MSTRNSEPVDTVARSDPQQSSSYLSTQWDVRQSWQTRSDLTWRGRELSHPDTHTHQGGTSKRQRKSGSRTLRNYLQRLSNLTPGLEECSCPPSTARRRTGKLCNPQKSANMSKDTWKLGSAQDDRRHALGAGAAEVPATLIGELKGTLLAKCQHPGVNWALGFFSWIRVVKFPTEFLYSSQTVFHNCFSTLCIVLSWKSCSVPISAASTWGSYGSDKTGVCLDDHSMSLFRAARVRMCYHTVSTFALVPISAWDGRCPAQRDAALGLLVNVMGWFLVPRHWEILGGQISHALSTLTERFCF